MINRVILQGFVVDEPYIHVNAENKMAKVRLATTEEVTLPNGDIRYITEWHTVIFWGDMAHLIDNKASAGTPIYLEGALRHRSYKDKQGAEHKTVEVVGKSLRILDASEVEGVAVPKIIAEQIAMRDRLSQSRNKPKEKIAIAPLADDPDELPF